MIRGGVSVCKHLHDGNSLQCVASRAELVPLCHRSPVVKGGVAFLQHRLSVFIAMRVTA